MKIYFNLKSLLFLSVALVFFWVRKCVHTHRHLHGISIPRIYAGWHEKKVLLNPGRDAHRNSNWMKKYSKQTKQIVMVCVHTVFDNKHAHAHIHTKESYGTAMCLFASQFLFFSSLQAHKYLVDGFIIIIGVGKTKTFKSFLKSKKKNESGLDGVKCKDFIGFCQERFG